MATDHSTDRNAFGHWLSGFVDGEGCFLLQFRMMGHSFIGRARFMLKLRDDDSEIMKRIHEFWGVGHIQHCKQNILKSNVGSGHNQVSLQIDVTNHLSDILVPHFERYPLRAKKQRDFIIWREGVNLVRQVTSRRKRGRLGPGRRGIHHRWTDSERTEFQALSISLRAQRQYNAPLQDIPPLPPDPNEDQPMLF